VSGYGFGEDVVAEWRRIAELRRAEERRAALLEPQAPYPDGLRDGWTTRPGGDSRKPPPPDGSPGQVLSAWMDREGRFPSPPGERERARDAQRRAIEDGNRSYELARELTEFELDDRLDGEAAKRRLYVARHADGSPVEDLEEMRSRVTEFRPQWKQAGTSQVRTGPW
jgi:hypothetical protein